MLYIMGSCSIYIKTVIGLLIHSFGQSWRSGTPCALHADELSRRDSKQSVYTQLTTP